MNTFILKSLLLVIVTLCSWELQADPGDWKYHSQVNVGCNMDLYISKTQRFPGVKFFSGISINNIYKQNLLLNYSASLGCYVKSLGNNLNPLSHDFQIDFTHSFIGGYYWGKDIAYTKYMRTLNNVPFNSMFIEREGAAYLGTMFIFNNHHRNQSVGCLGINVKNFSANYSNDGPPFNKLGLGDAFDRWWTGHGCLYLHSNKNYNTIEVGFDQFTGYSPLLYEISGILGINLPDYNISYSADSSQIHKNLNHKYEYNSSTYNIRINFDQNFGIDLGVIGSLKSNHDRYFAIQEIIHSLGKMPFHPNQDQNRFYIGPNYRYTTYVK
jgi:hypothetical protein